MELDEELAEKLRKDFPLFTCGFDSLRRTRSDIDVDAPKVSTERDVSVPVQPSDPDPQSA